MKKSAICYNILLGTRNLAETKGKGEFSKEVIFSGDRGDGVGCIQKTRVVCRAPRITEFFDFPCSPCFLFLCRISLGLRSFSPIFFFLT